MLKVRVQKSGEVAVLHLQGRIVNGQTGVLRSAIFSLLETSVVVLDFAKVTRVDAHGLGVLLDLRQQLQKKGIEFRIINIRKLVSQVFAVTKLDTVFQVPTQSKTHLEATRQQEEDDAAEEFALSSD